MMSRGHGHSTSKTINVCISKSSQRSSYIMDTHQPTSLLGQEDDRLVRRVEVPLPPFAATRNPIVSSAEISKRIWLPNSFV